MRENNKLNQEEQKRLYVLNQVMEGKLVARKQRSCSNAAVARSGAGSVHIDARPGVGQLWCKDFRPSCTQIAMVGAASPFTAIKLVAALNALRFEITEYGIA